MIEMTIILIKRYFLLDGYKPPIWILMLYNILIVFSYYIFRSCLIEYEYFTELAIIFFFLPLLSNLIQFRNWANVRPPKKYLQEYTEMRIYDFLKTLKKIFLFTKEIIYTIIQIFCYLIPKKKKSNHYHQQHQQFLQPTYQKQMFQDQHYYNNPPMNLNMNMNMNMNINNDNLNMQDQNYYKFQFTPLEQIEMNKNKLKHFACISTINKKKYDPSKENLKPTGSNERIKMKALVFESKEKTIQKPENNNNQKQGPPPQPFNPLMKEKLHTILTEGNLEDQESEQLKKDMIRFSELSDIPNSQTLNQQSLLKVSRIDKSTKELFKNKEEKEKVMKEINFFNNANSNQKQVAIQEERKEEQGNYFFEVGSVINNSHSNNNMKFEPLEDEQYHPYPYDGAGQNQQDHVPQEYIDNSLSGQGPVQRLATICKQTETELIYDNQSTNSKFLNLDDKKTIGRIGGQAPMNPKLNNKLPQTTPFE